VITAECEGELFLTDMATDGFGDGLADAADKTGLEHVVCGRIIYSLSVDLLELVVAVELDLPAKFGKLIDEAGFDETNRTLVYACPGLTTTRVERGERDKVCVIAV
jgi:hypothetical protein